MTLVTRRNFLSILAALAIVRYSSLMPVKAWDTEFLYNFLDCKPYITFDGNITAAIAGWNRALSDSEVALYAKTAGDWI